MKDCTTCKYGYEDERLGIKMCHHPKRFSEDCVDFNMHEEVEESEKATGIEEKKLPEGLDEAAREYAIPSYMKDVDKEHLDEYPYNKADEIAFKAGAEWQRKQMGEQARKELAKTDITLADLVAFDEGCKIGRRLERQDMLKDAVGASVNYYENIPGGSYVEIVADIPNPTGFRYKDKVKVIIVPEKEE